MKGAGRANKNIRASGDDAGTDTDTGTDTGDTEAGTCTDTGTDSEADEDYDEESDEFKFQSFKKAPVDPRDRGRDRARGGVRMTRSSARNSRVGVGKGNVANGNGFTIFDVNRSKGSAMANDLAPIMPFAWC